jgi:hypothetical protein
MWLAGVRTALPRWWIGDACNINHAACMVRGYQDPAAAQNSKQITAWLMFGCKFVNQVEPAATLRRKCNMQQRACNLQHTTDNTMQARLPAIRWSPAATRRLRRRCHRRTCRVWVRVCNRVWRRADGLLRKRPRVPRDAGTGPRRQHAGRSDAEDDRGFREDRGCALWRIIVLPSLSER